MKLHLGCGEKYLDGYLNIDFPSDNHTVQSKSVADRHCDVISLSFPSGSIDEVRLHHLFEHFSRAQAMALLCRWTDWLEVGGKIHIETPDWDASILTYISPFTSPDQKEQILRHLFGSHEASWAVHWDAWHKGRFKKVLEALGYVDLVFTKNQWGVTKNIEVVATRGESQFTASQYREKVRQILGGSLIKPPIKNGVINFDLIDPSELQMLKIWIDRKSVV
jgi:predicted SAM-dependent methyltransferase